MRYYGVAPDQPRPRENNNSETRASSQSAGAGHEYFDFEPLIYSATDP